MSRVFLPDILLSTNYPLVPAPTPREVSLPPQAYSWFVSMDTVSAAMWCFPIFEILYSFMVRWMNVIYVPRLREEFLSELSLAKSR